MTDARAGSWPPPCRVAAPRGAADDEVARLHDAALELLAARGAPVGGETALALLAAAGASVDRQRPGPAARRALVRRAGRSAPASFVLPGRVADRDVTIGGGRGGLMAATAAAPDVAAAALLADALPEVAVVGLPARRARRARRRGRGDAPSRCSSAAP